MYDEIATYMAQRDDARDRGDQAGYDYWRGYIDAMCDEHDLNRDDCEGEYRRQQQVAKHTLRQVTGE